MTALIETFSHLNLGFSFPVLFVSLLGLLLVISGIRRFWQRRIVTGTLAGTSGLCLIAVAVVITLLAINIHTYHRLTYEKPIVTLTFTQLGPQKYTATLEYIGSNQSVEFILNGDEWQLDARILRWEPALQILGFNSIYRLERLNGRYNNIDQELTRSRTVYSLVEEQGLDIWSLTQEYQQWLNWLDAYYGNATYLPMRDGARFVVAINQYGLIARPANSPAENALSEWD